MPEADLIYCLLPDRGHLFGAPTSPSAHHSWRSAIIGSTFIARRAGI